MAGGAGEDNATPDQMAGTQLVIVGVKDNAQPWPPPNGRGFSRISSATSFGQVIAASRVPRLQAPD